MAKKNQNMITEELETEAARETSELQNKIKELNRTKAGIINIMEDLEIANRKLRAIDEMKSTIIRDVSHELKTPLVALQSATELLQASPGREMSAELHEIIMINVSRLKHTIDSILNLNAIESGTRFKVEDIKPEEVIREAITLLSLEARKKNLEIKTHIQEHLPTICGDKQALSRVMMNLIDNAIKYTDKGSITVSLKKRGNALQFSVRDTGCGISKNNLNRLFEKFFQVHPSTQGPGLGLAISRTITKAHDGNIGVESEGLGKGSVFWFTLPIKR